MSAKLDCVWTIYCHTHTATGRRYVGQTRETMAKRWNGHCKEARGSKWGVSAFTTAIRNYGPDAFEHEVLEFCLSQHAADKAEVRWIATYGTTDPANGWNTQLGGTRAVRG